jgi:hypothetical protein
MVSTIAQACPAPHLVEPPSPQVTLATAPSDPVEQPSHVRALLRCHLHMMQAQQAKAVERTKP